ncbi:MAG: alpha/beta hydrolase, partial [Devosiaceae bacterium]|nr:alpha/beta hydrolase [Devosiaceae bacterium]
MGKVKFKGKFSYRLKSYLAISAISLDVIWRRIWQRPIAKDWSIEFEIGVLFIRHQYNRAFEFQKISDGRECFDSLIPSTGEKFAVSSYLSAPNEPEGNWHIANGKKRELTALYLHGGGYAFNPEISSNFAEMLAGLLNVNLFMLNYRLTPEHSHPTQLEDALAAYRFLLEQNIDPSKLIIIGDSAGGHLALMLLLELRRLKLPQPALAIGLCAWTDIGERGKSFYGNDNYDLVQGYMALRFGEWLIGNTSYNKEQLSPIYQDFTKVAPIYLQGGGREILIDMISDFAKIIKDQGAEVALDVWPNMVHDFQMHGMTHVDSVEAFERMREIIAIKTGDGGAMISSA